MSLRRIKIIEAEKADASDLTGLCIRSKSYWKYGKKQMEDWKEDLTISENYIEENEVVKLIINRQLYGFYAYAPENNTDLKLNFLFIEPQYIGMGFGKMLVNDFLKRIKDSNYHRAIVDSDPNSEEFYFKQGFRVIGRLETSVKDRFLPVMEIPIGG